MKPEKESRNAMRILPPVAAALITLSGACRGPLPPGQPPRVDPDVPETTTSDRPLPGPVAADAPGAGGTSVLPVPTPLLGGGPSSGGASAR